MTRFIKTRQDKKKKENLPKSNLPKGNSGSDITMCEGGDCPFKFMCHRYTALADEIYQSYFTKPPFKIKKGKPSCEMFWGEAANNLFIQLKEIMASEKRKTNTKATFKKGKGNTKSK